MDIRCERCRAAYVLEDEQVTAAGVALQCSNCGYLFEVKRKVVFVTTPLRPEQAVGALRLPPPSRAAPPAPVAPPAVSPAPSARAPAPAAPRRPAVPPTAARIDPPQAFGAGEVDLGRPPSTSLERSRLPQLLLALVLAGAAGLGAKVLWDRTRGDVDLFGREAASPDAESAPPPPDGTTPPAPDGAPPSAEPQGAAPAPAPQPAEPGSPAPPPSGAPAAPAPGAAEAPSAPGGSPEGVAPADGSAPAPAAPSASDPAPTPPPPGAAEAPAAAPAPAATRTPQAVLAEAGRLRNRGQIARALELYRGVLAQEPENVAALTGQGLCYLDLARYPSAETSFQAALRAAPADPDATLGLAETYRWQGNDAEAIRYYERYLAEHPDGEEAAVARNAIDALRR